MDEKPKPTKRSIWPVVALVFVLSLPIGYVLSIGPAYSLVVNRTITPKVYQSIYAPIIFVSERSKPVSDAVDSYCMFWWRHWGNHGI